MDLFKHYFEQFGEYGEVVEVNHPIVSVIGIPSARLNEIVLFENGDTGQVISLHHDFASVLMFTQTKQKTRTKLSRTGSYVSIPVGKELLGKIINPFGNPLSSAISIPPIKDRRVIDQPPQGITNRVKIKKPLTTGTALIDIMVPIGKGQRELVLGDRKTGKSSFVINTIRNQINEGAIAIYCAVGKKSADIKQLQAFMAEDDRSDKMIIVATTAFDSPGLIHLTPFAGMTLAEYFRDQGKDVLLIFDDMLTHAKFYREFALLAQTFPGRDSYPADVFHVHARLLERAGMFKHPEYGETSITCLPIVETQEGDLTGYIVSNLMSITDGHIFFDSNIFAEGRRPAVNIPVSVTRVGKQTQDKIQKDINRELSSLFAVYERVENLSHFGSEMTDSVKSIFSTGNKIYSFFNQKEGLIIPKEVALIVFSLIWMHKLNDEAEIEKARDNLLEACNEEETRLFLRSLLNVDNFNALLKNVNDYMARIEALCKLTNKSPTK
ncbi:MAG TPA: F0F1 ATP synthase subunit alpha [Patescibacteria group bacterium]|nr:F0F1 ATP synthase subunit alpha [Patescibacteria group bacterium]